jgi:hypothetical protein
MLRYAPVEDRLRDCFYRWYSCVQSAARNADDATIAPYSLRSGNLREEWDERLRAQATEAQKAQSTARCSGDATPADDKFDIEEITKDIRRTRQVNNA